MRVELSEKEIEAAIKSYINELGFDLGDKNIAVSFKAGRGPNSGHSAAIDIDPKPEPKEDDRATAMEDPVTTEPENTTKIFP